MTVLLTKAEMQALDRLAIEELGIPGLVLMEVAGRAVADAVEAMRHTEGTGARVVAIAGPGNNGGDAVVAARHLRDRGAPVELVLVGDPANVSPDLARQLAIAAGIGIQPVVVRDEAGLEALRARLSPETVAIDGLFGTGLTRPVTGLPAAAIDVLEASAAPVVAVDIPSGIDADTGQVLGKAVRARATVTFQHPKLGHLLHPGRAHAGELTVADIGIPRALLAGPSPRVAPRAGLLDAEVVRAALPPRTADTHKGTYGHLLVVAGVPDRPGSALLAGRAALRAGAGLVTLGSDEETIRRLAPSFFELMGLSLGAPRIEPAAVRDALASRRVLAIGPSLEGDAALLALLRQVLLDPALDVPAVLDAGALTALGRELGWLKGRRAPTILTPHPGEMARLTGLDTRAVQADRVGVARRVAAESGAHVLLKGASTVVAGPDGWAGVVLRGNPAMATGGAGDVLTGMLGALLAQGVEAGLAARAGAVLHAAAGDLAAAARGGRIVASDIADHLGPALALLTAGAPWPVRPSPGRDRSGRTGRPGPAGEDRACGG